MCLKICTLNISTSAAIVAASAGAKVAKHGNRSISSKSGSADMLEKIGYKISADQIYLENSLSKNNFCFLFAQYHHSAMKHVLNVMLLNQVPCVVEFIVSGQITSLPE